MTTLSERKSLLKSFGIEKVQVIKFNKNIQELSYETFIEKHLTRKLRAQIVFVGFDYAFGKNRSGSVKELRKLGKEFSFGVKVIRPVKKNHHIIKSSLIRNLITHGNFNEGVGLLGHPYRITGLVVSGHSRGRELGVRTANLKLDQDKLIPQMGVYLGKAGNHKCVINIGNRPTFGAQSFAIEVHLLRFDKDLYKKKLAVDLHKKIRDEIHFADIEDLKAQIHKDIAICQNAVL